MQSLKQTVGIIGASGYSGMELSRILSHHLFVGEQKLFAHSSVGQKPKGVKSSPIQKVSAVYESVSEQALSECDIIFSALPSKESSEILKKYYNDSKIFIDLSGDFRLLDLDQYKQFYGVEHPAPELLAKAVYGLPEVNRYEVGATKLISNPGCYPTSAILPLVPLLKEKVIAPDVIINSLSGVSGAGKKASTDLLFAEVNESVRAYRVTDHQHIPEIEQVLSSVAGEQVTVTFTPHLIPITRGIYTTTYAEPLIDLTAKQISELYHDHYGNEPFVRFDEQEIPQIQNVLYTNNIEIGFRIDPRTGKLIILSAIDNLVKGAAGQAVQNMNLACGFLEWEALV